MLLSQRAYARHRDVPLSSVQYAIKAGRIALRKDGKIDSVRADRDWDANTDPVQQARRRGTPRSDDTYMRARGARETYMARLAQLDYERRVGELIPAQEVRIEAFEQTRRARDLILAIPDRLGPMLEPAQRKMLEEEIARVLDELSTPSTNGHSGV